VRVLVCRPRILVSYRGVHTGTYGCTREVCAFRDALAGTLRRPARTVIVTNPFTENVDFKDSGITVVGISADAVPAIKAFVAQHGVTVGARITKRFPSRLGLTMRGSIRC
jgi:peroxiredoxin